MPVMLLEDARGACIEQAAAHYGANPDLIRAVLRAENMRVGQVLQNRNGSVDMGPMGINSIHLSELARYGITQSMLVNDECLNIHIGAYYLQRHILTAVNYWSGVGNYHSRTPYHNILYRYRVWDQLAALRRDRGRP